MEMEGLPRVETLATTAGSPTQDSSAGFAFVREVMRDLQSLATGLDNLKGAVAHLRADLEREQHSRKEEDSAVRRELANGLSEEGQLRADLDAKHEAFANLSKTWIGALGKDSLVTKERLGGLDAAMEQCVAQAALHEDRLREVDESLRNKCSAAEYKQLSGVVSGLQSDAVRDRAATADALDAAKRDLGHKLRATDAHFAAVNQALESKHSALHSDVVTLSDKVEKLDVYSQALARQSDLQMLEERMQKAEKTLTTATEDIRNKASAEGLKSLSGRVTDLSMEAHSTQTRNQMMLDDHSAKIGDLLKETAKFDRQFDLERTWTRNGIVALEKELESKPSMADFDSLGARMTTATATVQRCEVLCNSRVSSETFGKCQARLDQMEVGLIKKADSESFGKTVQAVNEQARQLEATSSLVREHTNQIEVLEGRADTMKTQLEHKAESAAVYSSDGMDDILKGYYSREEMDAIMSRLWWRLGDVSKPITPSTTASRPGTRGY